MARAGRANTWCVGDELRLPQERTRLDSEMREMTDQYWPTAAQVIPALGIALVIESRYIANSLTVSFPCSALMRANADGRASGSRYRAASVPRPESADPHRCDGCGRRPVIPANAPISRPSGSSPGRAGPGIGHLCRGCAPPGRSCASPASGAAMSRYSPSTSPNDPNKPNHS